MARLLKIILLIFTFVVAFVLATGEKPKTIKYKCINGYIYGPSSYMDRDTGRSPIRLSGEKVKCDG